MTIPFSYEIERISPFLKEGKTDYLFATVKLNIRRPGHNELGDNVHVHVQLPPGSEQLNFEELQDRAADEAFRLLKAASDLRRENAS